MVGRRSYGGEKCGLSRGARSEEEDCGDRLGAALAEEEVVADEREKHDAQCRYDGRLRVGVQDCHEPC